VQGSGVLVLDDGSRLRLGYAGGNGRPYVAIGRVLVDRGAMPLEAVSMQSIRAWLAANPAEADAVMNANPSYVFFREIAGEGPLGTEGVPLTPGRSLAVDRLFVPMGVPVWLDAADPLDPAARLRRLMVAQDTGGAIIGPARADIYFGAGDEAASVAGRIKHNGRFVMLLPHELDPKVLKGDIPLPLSRPTEQQIIDYKKNPPKDEDAAKEGKPEKGAVAAARRADKANKEAADGAEDDKPAKKRKSKIRG
jgi:membrane-bound lytic murein transglycosylase A